MELSNLMKKSFSGPMKWVVILAFVILSTLLLNYSNSFITFDNMENGNNEQEQEQEVITSPSASIPIENAPPTTTTSSTATPSDLLPAANSGQNGWDVLGTVSTSAGANPDLLEAGYHTGIDTIGQSLRNANLQLRSDPFIPITDTGPWNQTTIEQTNVQVPFNLGGNC